MNCLLLLIILFCCNGNSCNGNFSGRNYHNGNTCNRGCQRENYSRENSVEHKKCETVHREGKCTVDNRSAVNDGCDSCPASSVSRTQFPYLEIEPRTCGCEEKINS